jgi:hypothetical protein
METRQHLPPLGAPAWHVTVASKDGREVIAHQCADDEKECQAIATIARSQNLRHQIWIRSPFGRVYAWA